MRLELLEKPWRMLGFAWMQGSIISCVASQQDPSPVSQPMDVPKRHASSGMTPQGRGQHGCA
jgi:hypothetical protein